MSLADHAGFLALGLKAREIVELPAMRAVDPLSGRAVQLVEPPDVHEVADETSPRADLGPMPVRSFPQRLMLDELAPAAESEGRLVIPLAIGKRELEPAALMLHEGQSALVVSPPGGGRSSVLASIAEQVSRSRLGIPVFRIGVAAAGIRRGNVAGTLLHTAAELEQAVASTPRCLVLVDDAEVLDADLVAVLARYARETRRSFWLVVGATPDFVRSVQSWVAPIRSAATGVIVGGTAFDGDVLKVNLTKLEGLGVVPGRGHVIVRGRVQPAQLALAACSVGDPLGA